MRSEKSIQKEIRLYLKQLNNCFHYKTHGGRYESLKGKPDISGVINGVRFDFEVKKPGEKPTKLQEAVIDKFRRAGGIAEVVRSKADVKRYLEPVIKDGGYNYYE